MLAMKSAYDPVCVEAMACPEGLCLMQDLNLYKAVTSSDSMGVIRTTSSVQVYWALRRSTAI